MFCPSCGAEVQETKFCQNCGKPLPVDAPTEPAVAETMPEPIWPEQAQQPVDDMPQPIWPQDQTQTAQFDATAQIPQQAEYKQADFSGFDAVGTPQPPFEDNPSIGYEPINTSNQAPGAALVLVIVGLILSLLFVTFLPGIVCSIIGLVLNAGYEKKGYDNTRKTPTLIVGIIGLVIGIAFAVLSIAFGLGIAQVISEVEEEGASPTAITDVNGNRDSTEAARSQGATTNRGVGANPDYIDSIFHDDEYNPTFYAVLELTGAQMNELLDLYNFEFDSSTDTWYADDGSFYGAEGSSGTLDKNALGNLSAGAANDTVCLVLAVAGYDSPSKAFDALTKDVKVEDTIGIDDLFLAKVSNSSNAKYLVAGIGSGGDVQMFIVFTDKSISSGLFEELTGTDVGASVDEVWKAIKSEGLADTILG